MPRATFRPLVAHGAGPATAGDWDVVAGAEAGALLPPPAAGLDELAELDDVDDELEDDDPQAAAIATQISAAAT